jgi:Rad52/22 family double-strand break repair protein
VPEQILQEDLQISADMGGAGPKDSPRSGSESPAPNFPLDSYREAAIHLRRPFTAEAVKWKVQAEFGSEKALIVPYIDARLVIERLNLVCPHLWTDEYEGLAGGKALLCRLTIDGITRLDVGSGYQGKGLYSDAFKRAAVKFGIGVSLYALPQIIFSQSDGFLRKQGKKESLVLTDNGLARCASGYRAWLKEAGASFGEALDHGDVEGAYGDVEAETAAPESEAPAEEQPQKLTDAAATALIEKAEELQKQIPARKKSKATFKRELAGVWHDRAELEGYVKTLEGMADA